MNVATRADVVHILASGPLPEPETESLRAALVDAGLGSTTTSIELVPSTAVELTTGN